MPCHQFFGQPLNTSLGRISKRLNLSARSPANLGQGGLGDVLRRSTLLLPRKEVKGMRLSLGETRLTRDDKLMTHDHGRMVAKYPPTALRAILLGTGVGPP